ncbi:DUF4174 domain-containing protein [Algoriphagus aquimarinus]|uniref:DUF4174 domain-containing protein n=1 Tax=Algoriphagus aquimarinus TaxID=237018 RepID=A0A5C7AUN6_9BACT|nr:DUF4174 domain-containing protein [Algoriphagus aquimarinus]TXE12380.1 DUF4174 domain-containing protein [Algoriphagus aquimarinus]
MINLRLFFIAFLYMVLSPGNAQTLSSHQWKNRVIIVHSNDSTSPLFKSQILELKEHQKGLEERRLIIYQTTTEQFKKGLREDANWHKSENDLQHIKKSETVFEVTLLGLDGGIKLRKNELLTCEELFATIDQMPMRRSEIKKDSLRNKPDF